MSWFVTLLLGVFLGCVSLDQPPAVEPDGYNQYSKGTYYSVFGGNNRAAPTLRGNYTCMADWGIVCTVDSQCCSGKCLEPFCKIIGIEKEKKRRRKGPRGNRIPASERMR